MINFSARSAHLQMSSSRCRIVTITAKRRGAHVELQA